MNDHSVIRHSSSSSDIVRDIFEMHMSDVKVVYDLTYGNGTFWDWTLNLTRDCPQIYHSRDADFRATAVKTKSLQCVIFDPPFTSSGPSENSHNSRYGSDRSLANAPQNIHEVRALLASGLIEAMRISNQWILLKTQDVVESGKLHSSVGLAFTLFREFDFRIVDYVLYDAPRRPQPDIERGAAVRHFRNRPSVFILASRK